MFTILQHKKRWNKKAFSSIVGAIFMVLIVGMLASAYFIYTINQNTLYNEAVRQNNLEQISYLAESINVTAQPQYIVSANTVRLVTDLQNDGSVSVEIKTLWVHGINTNHYGYVDLDLILNPGQNATITQNIAVTNATSAESFYGWVVTTRGRTINLYPAHQIGPQGAKGDTGSTGATGATGPEGPPSTTALVSQGIGSISMDFKSYRSFVTDGTYHLGVPNAAFTFSRTSAISFSINVTNLDPSRMDLNLTSNCQFWIFSPASGAIKGEVWNIATVSNNVITPLPSNQFIIMPYNHTTTLYFGPHSAGTSSLNAGITAVNLVLTGKVGTLDYGQNLPFISLIAT